MLPYWLLFTAFAAGALQHRQSVARPVSGGPLLILMILAVALIVGLRYDVGGDWETYVEIFYRTGFLNLRDALLTGDPGYSLVNWTMYQLGLGMWAVNLVCAAMFAWGLSKFARSQPNPWLALLIAVPYLVIVVAMGYTRQAVALGFIMAGLASIQGRSILKFSIYIALAATFHKTAVVILPLVALATVRQHFLGAVIFAILFVVLYYTFLDADADRLVSNYVDAQYESEGAEVRVAMNVLPAVLFLVFRNRFGVGSVDGNIWRNFSLAALASIPMLFIVSGSTAVDRLALYLIPLQLFVFSRAPNAFSAGQRARSQMTLVLILYAALVQFVWLNYAAHAEYWLPYRSWPFLSDSV